MVSAAAGAGSGDPAAGEWGSYFCSHNCENATRFCVCHVKRKFDAGLGLDLLKIKFLYGHGQ